MNFQNNKAIYLQIADFILDKILAKKWKIGERIPSVRELGAELEVNPNTVLRAFDFLQNQNIIENKRGIGYFVSNDAIDLIIKFKKDKFFKEESNLFFKNMILLNISMEEIEREFNKFNKNFNKLEQ